MDDREPPAFIDGALNRKAELQRMSDDELAVEITDALFFVRDQPDAFIVRDQRFRAARAFEEQARRLPVTDPDGRAARRSALQLVVGKFDDFSDELAARYLAEPDASPGFATEILDIFRNVYGQDFTFESRESNQGGDSSTQSPTITTAMMSDDENANLS